MKKKVIYFLIVFLCAINIKMLYNVIKIKEEVSSVNMNVQRLYSDIGNIQSNVEGTINKIKEENTWVYDMNCKITNVSKNLKDATFILKWSVRDLGKDYKMYLLYGEKDEKTGGVDKWSEVISDDLGNLNYKKELKLPYEKDYEFKIGAKNDKNIISEKLMDINLLLKLKDRMMIGVTPGPKSFSNNKVDLSFGIHVENRFDLSENTFDLSFEDKSIDIEENLLKIKDIKIKVYSDNNCKKEIHLMKDGKLLEKNAHYQEPFKYQKDIKFEEIDFNQNINYDSVKDSIEEIEVIVEDNLGRQYIERNHGI